MKRARHEDQISASTFNLHGYHCCTKGKFSLKPAGKAGAHGLYTQTLIGGSLTAFSSPLQD